MPNETGTTVKPEVAAGSSAEGTVSYIEFVLRWASISYAAGFLTVMVNTAKIGIPALQLIEPVLVWVGMPLAIAFWLILRLRRFLERLFRRWAHELSQGQDHLQQINILLQQGQLTDAIDLSIRAYARNVLYVGVPSWAFRGRVLKIAETGARPFFSKMTAFVENTLEPTITGLHINDYEDIQHKGALDAGYTLVMLMGRLNYVVNALFALWRMLSNILTLGGLAALAVGLYILVAYPNIPQTWGGGKPVSVRLILTQEKVPLDDKDLKALLPDATGREQASKAAITAPVELLYATEHAYYVRPKGSPITQLNSEAVSGIIYMK